MWINRRVWDALERERDRLLTLGEKHVVQAHRLERRDAGLPDREGPRPEARPGLTPEMLGDLRRWPAETRAQLQDAALRMVAEGRSEWEIRQMLQPEGVEP